MKKLEKKYGTSVMFEEGASYPTLKEALVAATKDFLETGVTDDIWEEVWTIIDGHYSPDWKEDIIVAEIEFVCGMINTYLKEVYTDIELNEDLDKMYATEFGERVVLLATFPDIDKALDGYEGGDWTLEPEVLERLKEAFEGHCDAKN